MKIFENKSVIFLDILPNLYHFGIIKAFEEQGASVVPLIYKDFFDRSIIGRLKKKFLKKSQLKDRLFFAAIKGNYDFFFIKNPEQIPAHIFVTLKKKYPDALFINYNWNSINHVDYKEYIALFDKVYTFDPEDAEKYQLLYYPLFYLPEFENIGINNGHKKFLISFVGSAFTPGRANFIIKFIRLIKDKQAPVFIYLYTASKKQYYKSKLLNKYNFNSILFNTFFSREKLLDVYKISQAFIDHPIIIQKGHTMRTFETLAAGLLLITTNRSLMNEPFFDEKRISIIKEDLSDLDFDKIYNYTPSFPPGFEQYRIDNWLTHLFREN